MRSNLWMLLASVLPLLMVFMLPFFGIDWGWTLLLAKVVLFGMHLAMVALHPESRVAVPRPGEFRIGKVSILRLGFAFGAAAALAYSGTGFVVHVLPEALAIRFVNSLLHGIDIGPIVRWEMPWWEMVFGATSVFILGWLFGAAIAAFYNLPVRSDGPRH
jgi:hypothetical protein